MRRRRLRRGRMGTSVGKCGPPESRLVSDGICFCGFVDGETGAPPGVVQEGPLGDLVSRGGPPTSLVMKLPPNPLFKATGGAQCRPEVGRVTHVDHVDAYRSEGGDRERAPDGRHPKLLPHRGGRNRPSVATVLKKLVGALENREGGATRGEEVDDVSKKNLHLNSSDPLSAKHRRGCQVLSPHPPRPSTNASPAAVDEGRQRLQPEDTAEAFVQA